MIEALFSALRGAVPLALVVAIGTVPFFPGLRAMVAMNALCVGVLIGIVGTATRLEPASMVPVRMLVGLAAGAVVSAMIYLVATKWRDR